MMNSSVNQGTAKIYQFPAGGRAALGGRRYGETTDMASAQVGNSACSGSWYHQAAIDEIQARARPLMPAQSSAATRRKFQARFGK